VINHNNAVIKKNSNNHINNVSEIKSSPLSKIDSLDRMIMSLMVSGLANKQIAIRLKVPLSTIQRRTRKLAQKGIVTFKTEVNLEMLGFKRGLIHVYINDGKIDQIARNISTLDPIESVEIHIGNSDMIGNAIYSDSKQLLQTISDIKKISGVERIMWSEEVYNIKNNNNKLGNLLGN
jgi:Lrp/AsnC family transcriptional regulator for asnA, asnC and gidA